MLKFGHHDIYPASEEAAGDPGSQVSRAANEYQHKNPFPSAHDGFDVDTFA
ncbi:hypothetical protein SDC9_177177 [bioreactor metagenome]|uniref:Uncharacterized protein n=1 Tax=bioreactor metagenome TaxID=1076179 RepID=A0A645H090_9ZZZZ